MYHPKTSRSLGMQYDAVGGWTPRLALVLACAWLTACADESMPPPTPATLSITNTPTELMAVGDTVRLEVEVRDQSGQAMEGRTVVWVSDDPSIATVSESGVVKAVGVGTATIMAETGSASASVQLSVAAAEYWMLVAFYYATGGDEWTNNDGWLESQSLGNWHGVDVDTAGRVSRLRLPENSLTGRIPPLVGEFARLEWLNLSDNDLGGPIPPALGKLSELEFLWLGQNELDGPIPPELGQLDALGGLSLSHNALSGPLPAELGGLGSLDSLLIGDNPLSGPLPAALTGLSLTTFGYANTDLCVPGGEEFQAWLESIANHHGTGTGCDAPVSDRDILVRLYEVTDGPNWTNSENWLTEAPLADWHGIVTDESGRVTHLTLRNNGLRGRIPAELGNLARLEVLVLGENDLTGSIPPELGDLEQLELLWLFDNDLTGTIPAALGGLGSLKTLVLSGNILTGAIPPELGDLKNLSSELILSDNDLEGPIPTTLVGLGVYRFHWYGNRKLCAPGVGEFWAWLESVQDTWGPLCNQSDVDVLKGLFEAVGGPEWTNADGWLSGPVLDGWYGVSADSLGRVTELDLTGNGLDGQLPATLGDLVQATELRLGGNAELSGRLPGSLVNLSLRVLHYAGTDLCEPADDGFQEWINGIDSYNGTDVECPPFSDREILEVFYHSTGGPDWGDSENWLTDAPLDEWRGVVTNADGEVTELHLTRNGLGGRLPPETGDLSMLEVLNLWLNGMEGPVPPQLGRLSRLEYLDLSYNRFSGAIPVELWELANLEQLWLEANELSGPIPPELGSLPKLWLMVMYGNALTGTVPGELGGLGELKTLILNDNELTGLADEIGDLQSLEVLDVSGNSMSGPLPEQLGWLPQIQSLKLDRNDFSGAVPSSYGDIATLRDLSASGNEELSGPLPAALTDLSLRSLVFGDTEVCAPDTRTFQEWLHELPRAYVKSCGTGGGTPVYLTQAVQSIDHPVPLVAGDSALLRVFVTANSSTNEPLPEVRARFYLAGSLTHTANAARGTASIPTTVDEGRLDKSVNIVVPASVIRPGLEMVVDVDPDGEVPSSLGVRERIPASGRLELDVRDMPTLPLTIVPLLYEPDPDTAYAAQAEELTDDHELLHDTRTLLPVGDIDVEIHERVWTSTRNWWTMAGEVDALRVAEGGVGYYMGIIEIRGGIAYGIGSWTSISLLDAHVMAHELGHNMYLRHAPCGGAGGPDPSYPHVRGSSGAWGYDFAADRLVDPADEYDLMSYCGPAWVSDYHFTNATKRRLKEETENMAAAMAARPTQALLLWGGVDPDGNIGLEPAFVVDAPPVLPANPGPYRITGRDGAGGSLFSVNFEMAEHLDGDGEAKGFVLALPVQPGWDALVSIVLEGPEGTVAVDRESGDPVTLLLDPTTGRARVFPLGVRVGGLT
ncbi:MAG: hypothetical protein F4Y21_08655 [Gemmatimonadetes bacterium]|nr:hypothetical protein [Gemmatimonadota bacterium]